MAASFVFKDGQSGGTPASATNLNRLALTADLAIPGTPTGDALRTAMDAYYGGDTGWVDLSASSAWQTATWTSYTITSGINSAYRVKQGILYFRMATTYVAATTLVAFTTAGSEGNVTDSTILAAGAIPAAYCPYPIYFPVGSPGTTSGPAARVNPDGSIALTSLVPGMTLPTGTHLVGVVSWPID